MQSCHMVACAPARASPLSPPPSRPLSLLALADTPQICLAQAREAMSGSGRRWSGAWLCMAVLAAMAPISQGFLAPPQRPLAPPVRAQSGRTALAAASTDAAEGGSLQTPRAPASSTTLTWLEGNSWLWSVGGVRVLVDPIFDTLDFGMPALYKADKRVLRDYDALTRRMAGEADHVIITQGLPDHCCPKTLPRLAALLPPSARVIAPPSAEPVLSRCFAPERVTYVTPGDALELTTAAGGRAAISVYRGSLVGPPTQAPENAYLLRPGSGSGGSVFYEPHCMWREGDLRGVRADAIVTPTYGQRMGPEILHYTILNSGARAVELASALGASTLVSYDNVDTDATGALNLIVTRTGDAAQFEAQARAAGVRYVQAAAAQPIAL